MVCRIALHTERWLEAEVQIGFIAGIVCRTTQNTAKLPGWEIWDFSERADLSAFIRGISYNFPVMPDKEQPSDEQKQIGTLARYSEIGFIIPAAVLLGFFLGKLLDYWLHTKWIYIVGLIFGAVVGFVQMIRMATSSLKDGQWLATNQMQRLLSLLNSSMPERFAESSAYF
jgi:F0F1-type ATP synthase assembly protein I